MIGPLQQDIPYRQSYPSTGAARSHVRVEVKDSNSFPQTISIQTSQKGAETTQSPVSGIRNMIKSEQSNLNSYGTTGSTLTSATISIPGGGMAGLNNGAGDDGIGMTIINLV